MHSVQYIGLRNVGTSSCGLGGYPKLIALDSGGRRTVAADGGFFDVPTPAVVVAPHRIGWFGIETETICAAYPDGTLRGPTYRHLLVTLRGGGTVKVVLHHASVGNACGLRLAPFS
jgi:hypothetical protein